MFPLFVLGLVVQPKLKAEIEKGRFNRERIRIEPRCLFPHRYDSPFLGFFLRVRDHRREGADGRGPLPRLEPDEQGFEGRAAAFVGDEVDLVDDHAPEAQVRRGEERREALEGRDEYVGVRSTSAIAATR